jgi:hypothetical protein
MGYNRRNDEIRDNVVRMRAQLEAERDALATVRRYRLENAVASCPHYTNHYTNQE